MRILSTRCPSNRVKPTSILFGCISFIVFLNSSAAAYGEAVRDLEIVRGVELLEGVNSVGTNSDIALTKIAKMGSGIFPALLIELKKNSLIEKTNATLAVNRNMALKKAIERLSVDITIMRNDFEKALQSDTNPGVAAFALSRMGVEGGWVLVNALSNSNSNIRIAAAAVMVQFKNHQAMMDSAIPRMLLCLTNDSSIERGVVVTTLGYLNAKPTATIPALLDVATTDQNSAIRASAIGSVCRFSTNAYPYLPRLGQIIESEPDEVVREIMQKTIRSKLGVAPD